MTTCTDTTLSAHGVRSTRPTESGRLRTEQARSAWLLAFERRVDPDGLLDPAERRRLAGEARTEWMRKLALRSTQVRQANRRARIAAEQAPALVAEQARCRHSWPDELRADAECLDCGLAYGSWSE